jgi:hypothetical protein
MRSVSYEVFARSALPGDTVRGTVAELLLAIPYLLALRIVPPLSVMNEVLSDGVSDAGMSGGVRWEPFTIDGEEWEEVRATLAADEEGYRFVEPEEWVSSFEEWHVWVFEHLYGVPAAEHLRLSREEHELALAIERSRAGGDEEGMLDLHVKRVRVGNELAALLSRHLRPRS